MAEWFDLTSAWIPKLSGWSFVRPIKITEQSGNNLSDYQVLIELNSSNFDFSKAKSDGSDIRFLLPSGKSIPYWIESWDKSGQNAKVWVKVPSLPANSSTVIYMYYGNPSASSESNISATFLVGKDFNDGTTQGLTVDGGSFTVDNDPEKGYVLMATDTSTANKGRWTEPTFGDDIVVEGWFKWDSTAGWIHIMIINSDGDGYSGSYAGNEILIRRINDYPVGSSIDNLATASAPSNSNWNEFNFTRKSDGSMEFCFLGICISATDTTYSGPWQLTVWSGPANHKWEDLRVRKYTSPEPTLTVGPEIWL